MGQLPVTIDVRHGFQFNRSAPADIKASVKVTDLAAAAGYIDAVAASTGRLEGVLEIGGAADDPRFTGLCELKNGAFRLARSNEVYKDIKARIELDGSVVRLASLSGRKGK
ncbi:MAG: hypothetical protein P8181_15770, partial [bacterium]